MRHSRKLPVHEHYRVLFEVGSFCGLSDGELLARFVEREADTAEMAFAVLVERHATAVMRICRSVVRSEHDAEDAFQATFLILATKAGGLRVRESLGPWLAAVAQRVARGARAVALARAARELRATELAAPREPGSDGGADLSSIVHEEIDRLPERYRLPLLLCDIESYTHAEAARRLGWPLGTVKSRQARARARLRERLIRRGFSGTLPIAVPFESAQFSISESLIRSTARAAVGLLSRGAARRAISASVATLVTNFLRTTIVNRLTALFGGVLLITAGVAASVLAQGQPERKKPSADSVAPGAAERKTPSAAAEPAPVFQYEIRIWKDGEPVTPTMKLRAHPDDVSEVKIPEGTFELRFRPNGDSGKSGVGRRDRGKTTRPDEDNDAEQSLKLAQEMLNTVLDIIKVESDLETFLNAKQTKELSALGEEELQAQIADEFRKDPEVKLICGDIWRLDEQRKQAKAWAGPGSDTALQRAEEKYRKLIIDYENLWKVKYGEIDERVRVSALTPAEAKTYSDLKKKLASLKAQRVKQAELYDNFNRERGDLKTKK
jgi:RNA polymerase sigma factor (sigma-70 family)